MVSSHCIICGAIIVSGLYCHNCMWEIKRIRLNGEQDLESWIDDRLQPTRKAMRPENSTTLESFSSL